MKRENKLWLTIKKHKCCAIVIAMIIVLIIIPIIIYFLSTVPLLPAGENNDWAGFWGGYIGAIIGGVITLAVMWFTLKDTREEAKNAEKLKLFDTLLADATTISRLQTRLRMANAEKSDLCDLLSGLEAATLSLGIRLRIAEQKKLCHDADKVIKLLDDMIDLINKSQRIPGREDETDFKEKVSVDIMQSLCKNGFLFNLEKFIKENS